MRTLVLESVRQGLYQQNTATAYFYYQGNEGKPVDHRGHIIGIGYPDPQTTIGTAYRNHLENTVIPQIRSDLSKKGYRISGVDYVNMCPHPFVEIMRKDGAMINSLDLKNIEKSIDSSISNRNNCFNEFKEDKHRASKRGHTDSYGFFANDYDRQSRHTKQNHNHHRKGMGR